MQGYNEPSAVTHTAHDCPCMHCESVRNRWTARSRSWMYDLMYSHPSKFGFVVGVMVGAIFSAVLFAVLTASSELTTI